TNNLATAAPSASVIADGTVIGTITHPPVNDATPTLADMAWTEGSAVFTADSTTTSVEFQSTDPAGSVFGIALDGVSVVPDLEVVTTPDFIWGAPDPFNVSLDPGASQDVLVSSESADTGTLDLTASVVPAGQGVTVSLDSPTASLNSTVTLHVDASVGAAPGVFTATLTGTIGTHAHSVSVPIAVGAINGIPSLYEAVPIKPDGPDAGTDEDITDVPGDATKVYIAGLLKGTPETGYSVVLYTRNSCAKRPVPAAPAAIDLPAAVTPTADGTAAFGGSVTIPGGKTLQRYVSAQVTGPGSPGLIGPCIVVAPPNDQWPFAFDISSRTAGSGAPTQCYIDAPGRARWYKFNVTPGSSVHVALSGLPADYDVFLFK